MFSGCLNYTEECEKVVTMKLELLNAQKTGQKLERKETMIAHCKQEGLAKKQIICVQKAYEKKDASQLSRCEFAL